jgi:ribosome-associated toxin RatA of RatAB toxin-antitoxin module
MILRSFLPSVTKRHVEKKILAAPALHLFRIVADVDAYSTFLPLCSKSRIIRRLPPSQPSSPAAAAAFYAGVVNHHHHHHHQSNNNNDEQRFEAMLTVGLPPLFQETYTSLVVANRRQLTITSTSIQSSPTIDSLTSLWSLKEIDGGESCEVQLEVAMTVRDPIIIAALDQVLATVARQQVAAFSKRCLDIPFMPFMVKGQ